MKSLFTVFFLFCTVCAAAQTPRLRVGKIDVSATRVRPSVVLRKFPLKPGDEFTPQAYEAAQDKLHDLRLFKKLDFSFKIRETKADISIQGEDGYYFFPLAFFSAGDKDAFFMSVFEGNYFKRGETAFVSGGTSRDGYTALAGLAVEDNFFQIGFTKLDTRLRFYPDGWSSVYGVMSVSEDKDHYGEPSAQGDIRNYDWTLTYARSFGDFRLSVSPRFKRAGYKYLNLDEGNHNQLSLGASYKHNLRTSSSMGVLFGFGLSDRAKMLRDLTAARFAYAADISFAKGGSWSGADYDITRLRVHGLWQAELKQRHVFSLEFTGEDSYGSAFSDQTLSTRLLSGQGRYRRQLRGSRGAGAAASFLYYILRNDTGLLSLTPFYEQAYGHDGTKYRSHSGAGATLSYKFWRFPFPIGLNYTRNLSDSSQLVSFVLGGQF